MTSTNLLERKLLAYGQFEKRSTTREHHHSGDVPILPRDGAEAEFWLVLAVDSGCRTTRRSAGAPAPPAKGRAFGQAQGDGPPIRLRATIGHHSPMTEPHGRVAWIAIAPVKSMALTFLDRADVGLDGIPGDRAFAVIDEQDRLVNGKRAGSLATIVAAHDAGAGTLSLRFPDGTAADGSVALGDPIRPIFFGLERPAHLLDGPWDAALGAWSGQPLRLVAMDPGEGPDRGPTATLLSSASLVDLATAGGADGPLDRRRFRMTFGIDGVPAYTEDHWIGRDVRIGGTVVWVAGNVGRCAVTTHDPDTGRPSFDTLHVLQHQRGHLPTSEPLPFGAWAEVVTPGAVALGDPVDAVDGPSDTPPEY